MSQELIYTSVPRGLRPGATGFCTVAMTAGMPSALAERLELLGGYRPVFPLGDPQAGKNPVIWAHWVVIVGGQPRNILSRVAFAGADYSSRSNKFAHHLVVDPAERAPAGPAWVLGQPGLMKTNWAQEPRLLPIGPAVPPGDRPPAPCAAWANAAGDAGWAGVLADAFRNDPSKPAYLIFRPGAEMLPLIKEALALLPAAMRWRVTFSTYFTELPVETTCIWRCVIAGTPAAKDALRAGSRAFVIDLTKPLATPLETALTEAARTGRLPVAAASARAAAAVIHGADDGGVVLGLRPIDGHAGRTVVPIPPDRSRRRLAETDPEEYQVEEPNVDFLQQPAVFAADATRGPSTVRARRGVPIWATALIALGCLIGGVGVGYAVASFAGASSPHETATVVLKPAANLPTPPDRSSTERPVLVTTLPPPPENAKPTSMEHNVPQSQPVSQPGAAAEKQKAPRSDTAATRPRPAQIALQDPVAETMPSTPPSFAEYDTLHRFALSPVHPPTDEKFNELNPQRMNLEAEPHPDALAVVFPNNAYEYRFKDDGDELAISEAYAAGKLELFLTKKQPPNKISVSASDTKRKILTFAIQQGDICVWWERSVIDEKPQVTDSLRRILSFSELLDCKNGDAAAVLQLNTLDMNLNLPTVESGGKGEVADFAPALAEHVVLGTSPDQLDTNWRRTVHRDDRATYAKEDNGTKHEFAITLSAGLIQSSWDEHRLLEEYAKAKHLSDHKSDDPTIRNLDESLKKADDHERKSLQEKKDNRERAVDAALTACSARLDSFEQLVEFKIELKLRNGISLGSATVKKPSPGARGG